MDVDRDGSYVMSFDYGPLVVAAEKPDVVHAVIGGSHHLGRPERETLLLRVHLVVREKN